ncbi:GyrI-like domain-containing protein [Leifsonia sp. AG29]|uniref:GyrI-like domain-containing protein n=1 Tax=Leifsonia sp. AG29 TaxID=2598860 RepID=UPI001E58E5A6|nr:GyrI-like domain-containing protein [Leifsonia sp. AG29]
MTEITISQHQAQPTAVVRAQIRMDELPAFFSRALHDSMTVLQSQGAHPAGPPFGKYYGMPTDVVEVEAGYPTSSAIQPAGDVVPGTLPGGRVVEALHVGSYDTLQEAYADVRRYFGDA